MNNCKTLIDILEYRSKATPDKIIYTFWESNESKLELSFKELRDKVISLSLYLNTLSLKGERAILLYEPGLDFIISFFACLYSGIIAVPVYPPSSTKQDKSLNILFSITSNSEAKIILTSSKILSLMKMFGNLPEINFISTDNIENSYDDIFKFTDISEDSIAFLQYTSGSTSTPKGVIVTHKNLIYNQEMIKSSYKHDENSVVISWLPQYHDMGLIGNLLQPMYIGSHCIFTSPLTFLRDPVIWLKLISEYKAHTSGAPNFAYDLCCQKVSENDKLSIDLSSWEVAYNGSEPIKYQTLERFYQSFKQCGFRKESLFPVYGLAEATLFVSGSEKIKPFKYLNVDKILLEKNDVFIKNSEAENTMKLVSSGYSHLEQEIKIVNPKTLKELHDLEIGEIWLHGNNITQGYWNDLEKTNEFFKAKISSQENKYYLKTGDLGFLYENELYVTGRIKDLLIIRGRNIYPHDLERAIETLKDIHNEIRTGCNAIFSQDIDGSERVILFQEVNTKTNFDKEALVNEITKVFYDQFQLQIFSIILLNEGQIPKTSSGKIMRHACKNMYTEDLKNKSIKYFYRWDLNNQEEYLPIIYPEKSISPELIKKQEKLRNWFKNWIYKEIGIHPNQIDFDKSFAYSGIDSMTSLLLIQALEDLLETRIDMTILKDNNTINKLIAYLSENIDIT